MMRERISVSLEQRAPEMADVVRQREAIEGGARIRVVDRRLFTEKIRRDDKPLAAGGPSLCEPVEPLMDRKAGLIRRQCFSPPANWRTNQLSAEPPVAMHPFGTKRPGFK